MKTVLHVFLNRIVLGLAALCLLSACTRVTLPHANLPYVSRDALSDDALIQQLREDWDLLGRAVLLPSRRHAAMKRYNENMLLFIRRARYDYQAFRKNHGMERPGAHSANAICYMPSTYFTRLEPENEKVSDLSKTFKDIIASCDVPIDVLKERHVVQGLGVPLVAVVPDDVAEKDAQFMSVKQRSAVRCFTALLSFPKDSIRPVLRLIASNKQEEVKVGRRHYTLAQDVSAPIESYWILTGVKDWWLDGFTNPASMKGLSGIYCIDIYDPNRIPVILAHGLASSPVAFSDLVNRLMLDPAIRKNYQFWYYGYATSVSWPFTSMFYRDCLDKIREKVIKQGKGRESRALKNWDRKVLVGHSMGGLITHYSQCVKPWELLDSVATPKLRETYMNEKYVDYRHKDGMTKAVHDTFFFRPIKAGCVVYMATPHRGAPLAENHLTSLVRAMISSPSKLIDGTKRIIEQGGDLVTLRGKALDRFFISIDQLEPDSLSISGLQTLSVQDVPTYSIIGNHGSGPDEKSTDGIVPYWSSHISWGSEFVVKSDHSVQEAEATAKHMKTILREHLRRCGIKPE